MHLVRLLYKAFAERQPVAWINVFTPPELIFSCGYIPFWLDGSGGFSGWIEMTEVFENADMALPSRDMCTFLRAAVGGAMMNLFPTPRMVTCTSHLCEGAPKIMQLAAEAAGAEFSHIDVPAISSDENLEYVAAQLESVAHRLCEVSQSAFEIDKLREAIELSNRARKYYLEAYEMRKHVPAPVTGSQFIGMGLMYPWGTKIGVNIAQSFRDEIESRIANNTPAVEGGEKYRLMWLHLRPVFETDIMPHLEQDMRAVIVADLIGQAWWPAMDPEAPFRALAKKMLSNPELQPVEKRIERIVQLAEEYSIDGIVHFLQWGCRWNYGQTGILKEAMTRAGLPFLALDGDAVDKRATPHGQILTRLEGFVELLESTKSQKNK
jgi:benzoyl-CoA reductase/2-hydroxyglutaryl-CoA dehydratase subunit BcrC/BadD/HgdB